MFFWGLLAVLCAIAFAFHWNKREGTEELSPEFKKFQTNYLMVYGIMMGADWMQGPYVYQLYSAYGFAMSDIAVLFIAGFGSSMVFGTFVGSLADTLGRRFNCLVFGITYSLSCATKHFPDYNILMVGRLLGGVATSILYSAFESWMVYEHQRRGFPESNMSSTFSRAVFLNGIVAIVSGVFAQTLVDLTGSFVAPFDGSMVLLVTGSVVIYQTWTENYGDQTSNVSASAKDALHLIRTDRKVLLIGTIQSLYEGAMYTFVFMWTPALQNKMVLSHGLIFASFMVSCMIGSSIFGILMDRYKPDVFMPHVLGVAAVGLSAPVFVDDPYLILLGFLTFEVTCGIYWPALGTMRSTIVPENVRSTVMNVFRIPLNFIVVIVLLYADLLTNAQVFLICAGLLTCSSILMEYLHDLLTGLHKHCEDLEMAPKAAATH